VTRLTNPSFQLDDIVDLHVTLEDRCVRKVFVHRTADPDRTDVRPRETRTISRTGPVDVPINIQYLAALCAINFANADDDPLGIDVYDTTTHEERVLDPGSGHRWLERRYSWSSEESDCNKVATSIHGTFPKLADLILRITSFDRMHRYATVSGNTQASLRLISDWREDEVRR